MDTHQAPETISFDDFLEVDLRVGHVRSARANPAARRPAYVLEIDFGPQLGVRTSSAQLTENYTAEELVGRQVVAVLNFPEKRIAGVRSQVLVLAAVSEEHGTVLLSTERDVSAGTPVR